MALTDQPYIPFFVDDWMNNNKLKLCSPAAHGLMVSIMCLMHKTDTYGIILLKQKFKQKENNAYNFACQIARLTAFDFAEIENAFYELINEKVLIIEGDSLVCNRMVRDADISLKRSLSGRKGGKNTQSKNKNSEPIPIKKQKKFALAKTEANTVYGIEYENVNESVNENRSDIVKKSELIFPFESSNFLSTWEQWKDYKRKEFGFKFKSKQSEQSSLTQLANMAESERIAIEIIIQSMANGWKGFFELKETKNGSSKNNTVSDRNREAVATILNRHTGNDS